MGHNSFVTVAQLIRALEKFPPDAPVFFYDSDLDSRGRQSEYEIVDLARGPWSQPPGYYVYLFPADVMAR